MSLNANFGGEIGRTHAESTPWWPPAKHPGDDAIKVARKALGLYEVTAVVWHLPST